MARKIILYIHSTLKGVITGDPDGDKMDFVSGWTRNGNILGGSEDLVRLFDRVDTILLGHATYDEFARTWPTMQGPAEASMLCRAWLPRSTAPTSWS
jgi:dihydrofolate reductase